MCIGGGKGNGNLSKSRLQIWFLEGFSIEHSFSCEQTLNVQSFQESVSAVKLNLSFSNLY